MMGLRMRVHDREPIGAALRRFKKLLNQRDVWYKIRAQGTAWYTPSQVRRKKQFKKRLKARLATLAAQKAGVQPVASLADAEETLRKRTGKP